MKNTKGLYDLEVLNGLRVIVAFMIVLFHYNKLTGGSHAAINLPLYSVLKIAYVNGWKQGYCFGQCYWLHVLHFMFGRNATPCYNETNILFGIKCATKNDRLVGGEK